MMTSRNMVAYVAAERFRPFRIRMASGRSFDIRRHERIMVGRNGVRVYTSPNGDESLPERWHDVSMMLMETIEPIEALPSTGSRS